MEGWDFDGACNSDDDDDSALCAATAVESVHSQPSYLSLCDDHSLPLNVNINNRFFILIHGKMY